MEQQVIFRDRQEFQAADPNNLQSYLRDSIDHVVGDAVSDARHYIGFDAVAVSATELLVQPGRLYTAGAVYASEQEQSINLFSFLPLVTSRILAVVVWGQEIDTQVEPRDFLVDLETGATEPQAVAMRRARAAQVSPLAGTESAAPQLPSLQSGTLAVALVYLTPAGIERIEMQTASRLPNALDHAARLGSLEAWKNAAEPRISSIATDLAALAERADGKLDRKVFVELAGDVALLKDRVELPATYASYDADAFADDDKSDTQRAGWSARVENGLLFPFAASAQLNLALFNPIDAAVKASSQNILLPAYAHVPRISTRGFAGDLSISQYQAQALTLGYLGASSWCWHYGWHWNYYSRWYAWNYPGWGWANPWYGYHYLGPYSCYRARGYTEAYTGAMIAQTFLVSNAMWMTRLGLFFTQAASAGNVQVVVCGTEAGKPVLDQVVTSVTLTPAQLARYPAETLLDVPHVLLEQGKRYAIVLITGGDHRAAVVSGNAYTQGTLFYGSDGDYFTGDLTHDLMFTVYGALFSRARTEVQLQPLVLSGGMTDISIEAPHVVPEGCVLQYEVQPQGSGLWYPLGEAGLRLGNDATAPSLVNLRVVLLGTSDLQPAFSATPAAISVSRPGTAVTAWSVERTLGAATTSVALKLLLGNWDGANHAITPKIVTAGPVETGGTLVETLDKDGATQMTWEFTIPSAAAYTIKIAGTRASGSTPFTVLNRIDIAG